MDLKRVGAQFNRVRVDLNENFDKIEGKYKGLQNRFDNAVDEVADKAFDKVVDRAKIDWLPPVATFDDLATTYPNATEGQTAMTRDTGKVYRMTNGVWMEIQDIDPTAINEVDTRLNDKINQRSFSIMDFGAIGDGINDDTQALKNALTQIPDNSTLLLPKKHLIDTELETRNKKGITILCSGEVELRKDVTFEECDGLTIKGSFKGNEIPSATILAVDSVGKKLTLDDASVFSVGDQITVFTEDYYDICRYPGLVVDKSDNVITVDYNRIFASDPIAEVKVGQKIYITASTNYNHTLTIKKSNGIDISGNYDIDVLVHNCNYPNVHHCSSLHGEINLEFCYGGNVSNIEAEMPHFYGVFILGCNKMNVSNLQIKKPYFSGFVSKSVWNCNYSNIIVTNAAIHGIQLIRNTISNPTVPSNVNPLCQNDLTVNRVNIFNMVFEKCNMGIMVTTDCYNVQGMGIAANDNWGNVILANQSNEDISFSDIKIKNQAMHNPTAFTTNIPILVTGKGLRLNGISIVGSRSVSPLRVISSEDTIVSDVMMNDTKGACYIQSSDNVIFTNIFSKHQLDTPDVILITGNNRNVVVQNIKVTNGISANKPVNVIGQINNIKIYDVDIEGGSSSKGIYCEATGRDLTIERCVIKDTTDAIYVSNVVGVIVQKNKIQGAYNGIMLGPNTDDMIVKDNILRATVKIADNSSSSSKIIDDNLFLNPNS